MSETVWAADLGQANDHQSTVRGPAPQPDSIRFRPGQGGEMSPEWAAYMLNLWWSARDKKLAFAEAVKLTVVHFMVGEQP